MALPPSSSQPLGKPLVSSPASQVQDPENGNPVPSLRRDGGNTSRAARTLRRLLGWMTPHEQMDCLRQKRDAKRWEFFRDELMRKWSNLNIICGLIMGAISTIIFANYVLSRASFALGIICLLSSLIAIGFGVGLNYVLVDVNGEVLMAIDDSYPHLYLFALSIPEVWAFVSFGTFFADISVIVWQSPNKGWIVKTGTALAIAFFVSHLVAFALLFGQQSSPEIHPQDQDVSITFPSSSSTHILTPGKPSPLLESPNEIHRVSENLGQAVKTVNSGILATTSTSPLTMPSHTTNVPCDTPHPSLLPTSRPLA